MQFVLVYIWTQKKKSTSVSDFQITKSVIKDKGYDLISSYTVNCPLYSKSKTPTGHLELNLSIPEMITIWLWIADTKSGGGGGGGGQCLIGACTSSA